MIVELKCRELSEPPFLRLNLASNALVIEVIVPDGGEIVCESQVWSHTIFELEKLSEGMRYLADGLLSTYVEIPSRECWIGPSVGLTPALWFQLGHPGIGLVERGLSLYASPDFLPLEDLAVLNLEACGHGRAAVATIGLTEARKFAEDLHWLAGEVAASYSEAK